MMEKQGITTVIIEWRGPYLLEELKDVEEGNGLYLLTGRKNRSRTTDNELQYCGITARQFCKRVNSSHEKVKRINKSSLQVWIGCLIYPKEQVRAHLEDAEAAFVSFWDIKMNDKKKQYYPELSICIIARWHRPDGSNYKKFPAELSFIKHLDDVLWWDAATEEWRAGDLRIVKYSD